jgi:hypothetical protein
MFFLYNTLYLVSKNACLFKLCIMWFEREKYKSIIGSIISFRDLGLLYLLQGTLCISGLLRIMEE